MNKRAAFCLIAVAGAVLDYATKTLAFQAVPPNGRPIEVIPGWLRWSHSENTGIVWGLFQGMPFVFTLLSIAAIPVIVFLFWRAPSPRWLFTASLGMILAGALGNLYDRIAFGRVRDFIDVYIIHYPVFNVADSLICVGVGGLAWHLLFLEQPAAPPPEEASAPPPPDDAAPPPASEKP